MLSWSPTRLFPRPRSLSLIKSGMMTQRYNLVHYKSVVPILLIWNPEKLIIWKTLVTTFQVDCLPCSVVPWKHLLQHLQQEGMHSVGQECRWCFERSLGPICSPGELIVHLPLGWSLFLSPSFYTLSQTLRSRPSPPPIHPLDWTRSIN